MNFETYLVGGAVRDEILGVKPKDLDFVVLAPSFEAMEVALVADGAQIFVRKPEYVTIRCKHPKHGVADFACGRKESDYTDGRHPDAVVITQNLVEDLARRDFTIGAMAKGTVKGELVDPFNGRNDIAEKLVRCVGDPIERFKEDKLRLFRAIRFAVQKGFTIESKTADAIHFFATADFENVSTERIVTELTGMFVVNDIRSFDFLFTRFPNLGSILISRGIWFEPTIRQRPVKQLQNFVEVM